MCVRHEHRRAIFLAWKFPKLAVASLIMTSKKEKPLHSLIAGTTAGAIEAYVDGLVESALAQRV